MPLRVTAMSDLHQKFPEDLPGGDLLLDAGDWTHRGRKEEIVSYMSWLKKQLNIYSHIVFIAGNHERSLCSSLYGTNPAEAKAWMEPYLSDRLTYLQEEYVLVEGLKIYGAPQTPEFGKWAFNVERGLLFFHWDKIPDDTDILLTHGPPLGYGDFVVERRWNHYLHSWVDDYRRAGDAELLEALKRVKPKYHIFGHFHGAGGKYEGKAEDGLEGVTIINAALLDERYELVRKPIQFEI